MPNHTHLIAVPESTESLRNAIVEAHRRYARMINFRENWRGYLWQGWFGSYVMDESYLLVTARYIELNPVRANLVKHPSEYRWSGAQAHFDGEDDVLVKVVPLLDLANNWGEFLSEDLKGGEAVKIKRHERTGRPIGSEEFLLLIEALTGRNLQRRKPGPKGIRKMELHN